jgi:hypothetical protein
MSGIRRSFRFVDGPASVSQSVFSRVLFNLRFFLTILAASILFPEFLWGWLHPQIASNSKSLAHHSLSLFRAFLIE